MPSLLPVEQVLRLQPTGLVKQAEVSVIPWIGRTEAPEHIVVEMEPMPSVEVVFEWR